MSKRNPFVPSERVKEHEDKTKLAEQKAKERLAVQDRKTAENAPAKPEPGSDEDEDAVGAEQ